MKLFVSQVLFLIFTTLLLADAGLFKHKNHKKKHDSAGKHHRQHSEKPPTPEVEKLVQYHADEIKTRAKLPVKDDADKEQLKEADVGALGYKSHTHDNPKREIFFIRVIIGGEIIVHIKISLALEGSEKGASTLVTVLGNKAEGDKLDEEHLSSHH